MINESKVYCTQLSDRECNKNNCCLKDEFNKIANKITILIEIDNSKMYLKTLVDVD